MLEEPVTWTSALPLPQDEPWTVVVEVNVLLPVFGSTFAPTPLVAVTVALLVNVPGAFGSKTVTVTVAVPFSAIDPRLQLNVVRPAVPAHTPCDVVKDTNGAGSVSANCTTGALAGPALRTVMV